MKRETSNVIRFILEDCLPPILRDSGFFRLLVRMKIGRFVDEFVRLRENAIHFSPEDYEQLYRQFPRIHQETDNTQACLDRIVHDVVPGKICDVGCGTGFLLNYIRERRSADGLDLTGVDFVIDSKTKSIEGIIWQDANIEALPFGDQSFDTVVCTHSLEHILDFSTAVAELRRITKQRLIVVVPLERPYKYTFNPHLHFFPYVYSFLTMMHPIEGRYECEKLGRDIYFVEDFLGYLGSTERVS